MGEFWKTVRAYRKWVGWILVGGAVVLSVQQGWLGTALIEQLRGVAVSIIEALTP